MDAAIRSVLSQQYQNWEMLVIDDCSTDMTFERIKTFDDSRIFAKRLDANIGFGAAYNLALRQSSGEIIMNIGSDDAFHPLKLTQQVEYLRANPTVGIVGTHISTNLESWSGDHDSVCTWFNGVEDINEASVWVWQNRLAQSSVAIRREVHVSLGSLDPTLPHTLDWEFWLRALVHGIRMDVIPEVLTFHRIVPGSVTHADPVATGNEYMEICCRYFAQWLRMTDRASEIFDMLNVAIDRYNNTDVESKVRLRQHLNRLLSDCPESFDLLLELRRREIELQSTSTQHSVNSESMPTVTSRVFGWWKGKV